MRLILSGLLAILIVVGSWSPALAGNESRFYDAKGRYQGRATTNTANPKQQNLYDAKGRYIGRVMTDDRGNARVYDKSGKYQGRATGRPSDGNGRSRRD